MSHSKSTTTARINAAFFAAALILSLHALPYRLLACFPPPPHGDDSPEALTAGIASTPYQYRVLVPWMVRGAIEAGLIQKDAQLVAFMVVEVVALVLLAFAFRRYLSLFIADRVLASAMALSLYAVLPFNYFNVPFYPYDIPSVLFFTSGLLLIHDRNWMWFYPLFAAATLNRETSIFLVVVTVFVLYDKYSWSKLSLLVVTQLGIWAAIKAVLWELYRSNRWLGYGLYEFQLRVNIATIHTFPIKALAALSTWGCLWLAVVLWHRRIHHEFLRRNLWTVPVFVASMFVVGFVLELRIYGEVLPIVVAAFWVVFLDVVRDSIAAARPPWPLRVAE